MKKASRVAAIAIGGLLLLILASYQWMSFGRDEGYAFDPSLSPNILRRGVMNFQARFFNDPVAQFALGRYERFVNLDYTASNQWMEKSASHGYPEAMYMLAAERLNSVHPLSNEEKIKAYEMMRNAARAGNVPAMQYLAKNPDAH